MGLHRSSKVRGNVETPSIMIEKGAMLQGEVKMTTGDKGVAVKPLSAAGATVSK